MLPDTVIQELEMFAVRHLNAKQTIETEKKKQKDANAEIASRIPIGDKTQRTETLPASGKKIIVKGGSTLSVDTDGISRLFQQIGNANLPVPLKSVTTTTVTLDARGYEWYKVNHPDVFLLMSEFVTLKPKNLSVTVQEPKKES